VDGHHHIHIHPLVAEQLAPLLAKEFGVYRIRLPVSAEDLDTAFGHDPEALAFHRRVQAEAAQAEATFRRHGLRSPEAFVGIGLMGSRMLPDALTAALARTCANLPEAATTDSPAIELMCHPGHAHPDGAEAGSIGGTFVASFGSSPDRQREFDTLHAVLGGAAWPAGFRRANYANLVRPAGPPTSVRTLIYGKLSPASGNRTTADRLGEHLASLGEVLHRPLPPGGPREASAEIGALRTMVDEEGIDLVIGIHCGRAGKRLQQAFSSGTGVACAADSLRTRRQRNRPQR
jgi:hypothetical protein